MSTAVTRAPAKLMSAFTKAIIAGRYQRLLQVALWAVLLGALIVLGYGFIRWQVGSHIAREHSEALGRLIDTRSKAVKALRMLSERTAGVPPCTGAFMEHMREIAFLPDGLNEFIYAPDGNATCSTGQPAFPHPVPLGEPDIASTPSHSVSLRVNRDLAPLGRPGLIGTIAQLGDFAVAIPPHERDELPPWMRQEVVAKGENDKQWNITGEGGLYQRTGDSYSQASLLERLTTQTTRECGPKGVYCVTTRADLLSWAGNWTTILASIVALSALFAWISAGNLLGWLRRHWSFEERFKRGLNAPSIVVAYQPIMDLRTNSIAACEVLARWRDVDGTIVQPKAFVGIVARLGRTAEFTQMVVDRAWEELSQQIPQRCKLQVNFNVFASDFETTRLLGTFTKFLEHPERFSVAVELVEDHDIDLQRAQKTIQELSAAGIAFYIDDFGTGYSSIERVACLNAAGVKLDRSFAMSPPDSVLGRMLVQVIEMVGTSGRRIVVEGVETPARLEVMRQCGMVDWVQGYVISPPLGIDAFVALLDRWRRPRATQKASGAIPA